MINDLNRFGDSVLSWADANGLTSPAGLLIMFIGLVVLYGFLHDVGGAPAKGKKKRR